MQPARHTLSYSLPERANAPNEHEYCHARIYDNMHPVQSVRPGAAYAWQTNGTQREGKRDAGGDRIGMKEALGATCRR